MEQQTAGHLKRAVWFHANAELQSVGMYLIFATGVSDHRTDDRYQKHHDAGGQAVLIDYCGDYYDFPIVLGREIQHVFVNFKQKSPGISAGEFG